MNHDKRVKLLSISGGGYLGLYSALALEYLEGKPSRGAKEGVLFKNFAVAAGTSIGGILALAIALKRPAYQLVEFFIALGPDVFPAKSKWSYVPRLLLGPLYESERLRRHLIDLFGEATTLGEAEIPVAIPALNLSENRLVVFRGGPMGKDAELRAIDVALATAAAPFYFPAFKMGSSLFADGGLAANNPDLLALQLAFESGKTDLSRIHLLSLGTTIAPSAFSAETDGKFGASQWLKRDLRILRHAMKAQADLTEQLATTLLHDPGSYLRVNVAQTEDQARLLGIDRAGPRSNAIIQLLFDSSVNGTDSPLVQARNTWINYRFPPVGSEREEKEITSG